MFFSSGRKKWRPNKIVLFIKTQETEIFSEDLEKKQSINGMKRSFSENSLTTLRKRRASKFNYVAVENFPTI